MKTLDITTIQTKELVKAIFEPENRETRKLCTGCGKAIYSTSGVGCCKECRKCESPSR